MNAISRRVLAIVLVVTATAVGAALAPGDATRADDRTATLSSTELDDLCAFARLFGVVRFFYPSDAAAETDWNRFAVHGVSRVRPAPERTALARSLQSLVAPLGPGIVVAPVLPPAPRSLTSAEPLVAWRYLGAGFSAPPGPYMARRTQRAAPAATAAIDGFVTVMQSLPADALRGHAVRLRGRARVRAADASGAGALWLRVDRPRQEMGFFDNMSDRPIKQSAWREYLIEGTVADDAVGVSFGVMASGSAVADFDAIELSTRGPDGGWTVFAVPDAGFEAAREGSPGNGWFRAGSSQTALVTRIAEAAPEGRQCLRLAPSAAPLASATTPSDDPAAVAGDHADFELGDGLRARVPLALTDGEARIDAARRAGVEALRAAMAGVQPGGDPPSLDVRLADVVVAWNVYRHFYPYWTETGVDWDARLPSLLQAAARATTRSAHEEALKALVHDVRDGHGSVVDTVAARKQAGLPLQLAVIEDRLAVTASAAPDVPVGAVVLEIDGAPATAILDRVLAQSSGTVQWRRARGRWDLGSGAPDTDARLRIEDARGTREATLRRRSVPPPVEKRPDPVSEIEPGIYYVDLTRTTMKQLQPLLDRLASARAVVFDVRGYPTDAGAQLLPHLIEAPEADRWMHVARITGPFGRSAGWLSMGWDLRPAAPHVGGRRVFLTDARAISYAESVMGYVADRKLGTIVGSATAGTNGNVATFDVPGGFRISFTAMRVTGHDGQKPHHLVGIRPDVPVEPTIAGLRAGRDEVLERGLELAREP